MSALIIREKSKSIAVSRIENEYDIYHQWQGLNYSYLIN